MSIRERIIRLRELKNMNKSNFAEFCKIPQPTYNKYENGERNFPLEIILQIAEQCGVSPVELLADELGLSGRVGTELDYTDPMIESVASMMASMPAEKRRDVFNYTAEKKQLIDLLKSKAG